MRNRIEASFAITLCAAVLVAAHAEAQPKSDSRNDVVPLTQPRDDSVETKLKLLHDAWERQDFDLARSLTHSLRDSFIQAQHDQQRPPASLVDTQEFGSVESLSPSWKQWAKGWKYFKAVSIEETANEPRSFEPVELSLSFPSDHVTSLHRELRVAAIRDDRLFEVPSQILSEVRRGEQRHCSLLLLVDSRARQKQNYLILYGNANAELPAYPSDLKTEGEGYGLDISNAHFKASLSRQTGQLERLTLRREHGLELFAGGEGHGEPPGIDWAHDYVDEGHFQKLRITLWEECPDYEVIRGPLCTIVRRWGFPHSPIHPVFAPSRLHIDVEYRFYAGLPWFHKMGSMKAIENFTAAALRDDEWVFSGQSFTDPLWMDRDGKLHSGEVDAEHREDLWGVGFFNKETKDSFLALYLEHSAEGIPELKHTGAPSMYYHWHGSVWSRYPLPVKDVPAGAVLKQKNAYVAIPFTDGESQATIEALRRAMMKPLVVSELEPALAASNTGSLQSSRSDLAGSTRLARPGEADDASIPKHLIWEALRDCKDGQLYTADISMVDLGLVYDVRVQGDVVTLVMTMPHRGRSRLGYFIDGSTSVLATLSVPIRERLLQIPGVRQVVFEQTWEPAWNSNRLTDEGRKKLGL